MHDVDAAGLRSEIARLGVSDRGRRYPRGLQERVVAWAKQKRADGLGWVALQSALGVPKSTLIRWLEGAQPRRMRAVIVTDDDDRASPTLVTARGDRVEGLDIGGIATLIRLLER